MKKVHNMAMAKRGAIFLAISFLGVPAFAVTENDLQKYIEKSQPRWQDSAEKLDSLIKNPPDKYAADTWQDLDKKASEGLGNKALDTSSDPHNPQELEVYMAWLAWKVTHQADPRYSYAYAADLRLKRDDRGGYDYEMAVYSYHARLALEVDGAQCADGSVYQDVIAGFESQKTFKEMMGRIDKLSSQQRYGAMIDAIALETMLGERTNNSWLCRQGTRSVSEAVKNKGGDINAILEKDTSGKGSALIGGKDNFYTWNVEAQKLDATERVEAKKAVLDKNIKALVVQMNN